ncbi:Holliday junction branch migration protein RuvA [Clostridium vitabionis]|uniref:Holliday junction branch migration protein RuvA n=1 Tax=Clostridium vitabionis TaxID=2784388 RepID=UPI001889FA1B|nr:Holliday junction branch migration protein RuvA [Clostridium vitabionis]
MISYIKGILTEKEEDRVTVEAGQVGFMIQVPLSVLEKLPPLGSEVRIYTYMQVREDDISLFGFLDRSDLRMFRDLLGVSGVGPKGALAILGALDPGALRSAIFLADDKAIARAPGIGIKTAKRIVLELKDKVKQEDILDIPAQDTVGEAADPEAPSAAREAIQALVALGYSTAEASRAVGRVEVAPDMDSEAVLKASLRYLSFL